eukprot:TRINITY_DN16758_c0_g1_i2.p1 TRINITY_DN16758_c0_g1~~TRINITY_DN16758_c0_g1_i2.p1  ORF type:complete len:645 (+),score=87.36 TRINITY_DN16758_c0_g1_i2:60-1994(+)
MSIEMNFNEFQTCLEWRADQAPPKCYQKKEPVAFFRYFLQVIVDCPNLQREAEALLAEFVARSGQWLKIPINFREDIKTVLLSKVSEQEESTLILEESIAHIACSEANNTDILTTLLHYARNGSEHSRAVAITTLRTICEELHDLNNPLAVQIVNAALLNIATSVNACDLLAIVIRRSPEEVLRQINLREILVQVCGFHRAHRFACLAKIAEVTYSAMRSFCFNLIHQATLSDPCDFTPDRYIFWIKVCEKELQSLDKTGSCLGLIEEVAPTLIPQLLYRIRMMRDTACYAAERCFELTTKILKDKILNCVWGIIRDSISISVDEIEIEKTIAIQEAISASVNPRKDYFGKIMEGDDHVFGATVLGLTLAGITEDALDSLKDFLQIILSRTNSVSPKVRLSSFEVLDSLIRSHPKVAAKIQSLVEIIKNSLEPSGNEEEFAVSSVGLRCLSSMVVRIEETEWIQLHFHELIKKLTFIGSFTEVMAQSKLASNQITDWKFRKQDTYQRLGDRIITERQYVNDKISVLSKIIPKIGLMVIDHLPYITDLFLQFFSLLVTIDEEGAALCDICEDEIFTIFRTILQVFGDETKADRRLLYRASGMVQISAGLIVNGCELEVARGALIATVLSLEQLRLSLRHKKIPAL